MSKSKLAMYGDIIVTICLFACILGAIIRFYMIGISPIVYPDKSSLIVSTKYLECVDINDYQEFLNENNKYMTEEFLFKMKDIPSWILDENTEKKNQISITGGWSGENKVFITAKEVYTYFNLPEFNTIIDIQKNYENKYNDKKCIGRYYIYKIQLKMNFPIMDVVFNYNYFATCLTDTAGKVKDLFIRLVDYP